MLHMGPLIERVITETGCSCEDEFLIAAVSVVVTEAAMLQVVSREKIDIGLSSVSSIHFYDTFITWGRIKFLIQDYFEGKKKGIL